MGLAVGGFWWRTFTFNWFGHQSRLDLSPGVCATGHLLSFSTLFSPSTATRLSGTESSGVRTDQCRVGSGTVCGGTHGAQTPVGAVSYTHLRAHETVLDLVC